MIFQQIIFVQRVSAQKIDFTEMEELSYYLGNGFNFGNFSKHSEKYFTHRKVLDSLYLFDKSRSPNYMGSVYTSIQDSSVFNKKKMIVYYCRKSKGKVFEENIFRYAKKNRTILHSIIKTYTGRNGEVLPIDTINELYKYDDKNLLVERQITNSQGNRARLYKYGYKNGTLSYIINDLLPNDTLIKISIDTISAKNAYYRAGFATQLQVTIIEVGKKIKLITRLDSVIAALGSHPYYNPNRYYVYYLWYDQLGKLNYLVRLVRNDNQIQTSMNKFAVNTFEKHYKYNGKKISDILTIERDDDGISAFASLDIEIQHFTLASKHQIKNSSKEKYSLTYFVRETSLSNLFKEKFENDSTKQKEILNRLNTTLSEFGVVENLVKSKNVREVKIYSYKKTLWKDL